MSLNSHSSVGQVAARLGVKPTLITNWFYTGILDSSRTQMVAGRRMIPDDYLPEIRATLIARGQLQADTELTNA